MSLHSSMQLGYNFCFLFFLDYKLLLFLISVYFKTVVPPWTSWLFYLLRLFIRMIFRSLKIQKSPGYPGKKFLFGPLWKSWTRLGNHWFLAGTTCCRLTVFWGAHVLLSWELLLYVGVWRNIRCPNYAMHKNPPTCILKNRPNSISKCCCRGLITMTTPSVMSLLLGKEVTGGVLSKRAAIV